MKGMIGKFSTAFGNADINIEDMTNKSKGDFAYTLLDIGTPMTDDVVAELQAMEGVIQVRVVK